MWFFPDGKLFLTRMFTIKKMWLLIEPRLNDICNVFFSFPYIIIIYDLVYEVVDLPVFRCRNGHRRTSVLLVYCVYNISFCLTSRAIGRTVGRWKDTYASFWVIKRLCVVLKEVPKNRSFFLFFLFFGHVRYNNNILYCLYSTYRVYLSRYTVCTRKSSLLSRRRLCYWKRMIIIPFTRKKKNNNDLQNNIRAIR